MSPTNLSKSAMVKSPGVLEGSVGFQLLPEPQIRLVVAVHEADEHFRHDGRPDWAELFAAPALLRLFQDVASTCEAFSARRW
jgi:hypothetical protein